MSSTPSNRASHALKFIIPSLIGIFLFMVPISTDAGLTVPVALLAGWLETMLSGILPALGVIFIGISVAGAIIARFRPFSSGIAVSLFHVTNGWLFIRILGFLFAFLTLFQIGPDWLIGDATGGLLLYSLILLLITVFFFAGYFLPFLLNFGLLEFFGSILTILMRPLFTLPGRSSIDGLASWLGDGTIGVLLTSQQYESGHYTQREAAVISTTFSVVSITFTITILGELDLLAYTLPYYLTIVAAGVVCALIMPRIPPLSRKKNEYYNQQPADEIANGQSGKNPVVSGWEKALHKASHTRWSSVLVSGTKNVLDMWISVIPIVMGLGTIAVVIAESTPLFAWLGAPFVPLLQLMQVPEATVASETMLIGFADMFLPAILGTDIESEMTRFIIGALSVSQLIYMSEVGGLLLGSKLPVRFADLVLIFLERTIISLPVIVLIAHFIF
ncbi:hypothetical protein CHL76_05455 [Marinococcus halophilus]|uniref:Membrane protein n=1 Tax=Marinococcus halophilus TaxID=1371 RepID=A0A510Y3C5_MARHA|nr:YjiH family protein [Marinococcus halophilus]OZT80774.1 hypothetical protein CHL76_05455 [Marinococcus halophilus]GEK57826.1 membrane protein [Marinococcus halophilus]